MTTLITPSAGDLAALREIAGPGGVVDAKDGAPLLTEWRGRWPGRAALIVAPESTAAVARIVAYCAERRIGVTPQGGNTGLVGGQMPQGPEILLILRRMSRIRDVSAADNTMVLEAGVTLAAGQEAAGAADRLFPLSIGSEGSCQIGGAISTNAGGVAVLRYGTMRDLVLGVEAVLPSGEIWNGLKRLRKDNTGYDLKQLFIGAEGTLGIITAAAVRLFPRPRETLTLMAAMATAEDALKLLHRLQGESGGLVSSFELMSAASLALVMRHIPDARDPLPTAPGWRVLVELTSGRIDLGPAIDAALASALEAREIIDAAIAQNGAQAAQFWRLRHSISEAMRPEGAQAKFDVSVPVAAIPAFLREAGAAAARVLPGARIVAFGHVGDGNIHYDILQPPDAPATVFEAKRAAIDEAIFDCIDAFGGSISAEHGVGLARRADIARRKAPAELEMMRAIKRALDPQGIMNPGKML